MYVITSIGGGQPASDWSVSTLDDVRDYVTGLFPFPAYGHRIIETVGGLLSALRDYEDATILIDGRTITVQWATWDDLVGPGGWGAGTTEDDVLNTYNNRSN